MATISVNKLSALALCTLLCCACEDNDPIQYGGTEPLSTPVISLDGAEFDYLAFSWSSVEGAVEYGYELQTSNGKLVTGGLLKSTTVEIEDLTYCTDYQFVVRAYADVTGSQTTSADAVMAVRTPFYSVVDASGTYNSAILTTKTWNPTLVETRAAGQDDHFGTFTLESWYGTSDYDLTFEVDVKGKFKVLNGTVDEATGWQLVLAGPSTIATNQYVRKGVLVDESRCSFDYEAHELKLYVRSTKDESREGYDIFEWDEE